MRPDPERNLAVIVFAVWLTIAVLSLVAFCFYAAAQDLIQAYSCLALGIFGVGGAVVCIPALLKRKHTHTREYDA